MGLFIYLLIISASAILSVSVINFINEFFKKKELSDSIKLLGSIAIYTTLTITSIVPAFALRILPFGYPVLLIVFFITFVPLSNILFFAYKKRKLHK